MNLFEEKEKDRSDSEAGKFNKMMAAFQAKQTANAAIANMNVNPDDVTSLKLLSSKCVTNVMF